MSKQIVLGTVYLEGIDLRDNSDPDLVRFGQGLIETYDLESDDISTLRDLLVSDEPTGALVLQIEDENGD